MYRPHIQLLDPALIPQILDEAFAILENPGVIFQWKPALELLADFGAEVNFETKTAQLPRALVERALSTAPREFFLHDAQGEIQVRYGGDAIHFDPGSSALWIYDSATQDYRTPETRDFVRYARLADALPAFDALSTAFIPQDVPNGMADLYRLYLCLRCSDKPVVTGAFAVETFSVMRELLSATRGGDDALKQKPRAVFDACPTPPLQWSDNTSANLIEGAQHGIPMELVAMPLAGAAAPITLIGSVVQQVAENFSGLTLHQCAQPGSPIVFGGAPAIFDMRMGVTPLGALESSMLSCAATQVAKHLNLPTHGYLGLSDTKVPDMQAGWETGMSALLGALAGVNMMSGAGLLDSAAAFSIEKMIADAEVIAMARKTVQGIAPVEEGTFALDALRAVGPGGTFLDSAQTFERFRLDQIQHTSVVDRVTRRTWLAAGKQDTITRARAQMEKLEREILSQREAKPRVMASDVARALEEIVAREAKRWGMDELPALD
ncbi:MAG: trimethylamine methyltransferase family protein [Chloroflexi bacterium]|nr:trimethylamine methyltransferase family protein [Chloroflexota bacterium]